MPTLIGIMALFVFTACSGTPVPEARHGWVCRAASASEPNPHAGGHNGTCDGSEGCAREYALRECGRYHNDCKVILCRVEDRTADKELIPWPR